MKVANRRARALSGAAGAFMILAGCRAPAGFPYASRSAGHPHLVLASDQACATAGLEPRYDWPISIGRGKLGSFGESRIFFSDTSGLVQENSGRINDHTTIRRVEQFDVSWNGD